MEKALNDWIIKKQKVGTPSNGPLIREKAGYNKLISTCDSCLLDLIPIMPP